MADSAVLPPLDPFDPGLEELRKLVKGLPKVPSPGCLVRWHRKGVRGRKLRVLRIGVLLYSTRDELTAFLQSTTDDTGTPDEVATAAPDHSVVDSQLIAAGLLDDPSGRRGRGRTRSAVAAQ
jgi:hypothetical protein